MPGAGCGGKDPDAEEALLGTLLRCLRMARLPLGALRLTQSHDDGAREAREATARGCTSAAQLATASKWQVRRESIEHTETHRDYSPWVTKYTVSLPKHSSF